MISTSELNICIKENLFDMIPMTIAVIDNNFNIVHANNLFKETFGQWENKKCHEVYKNSDSLCKKACALEEAKHRMDILEEIDAI